MDPQSEHGDGPRLPELSSAPAAGERAEAGGAEPASAAPPAAAPPRPSPEPRGADSGAARATDAPASAADPADTLSPAVRRLVREYDLDITGVHGSGPAGKIRVGDIIGMLDGRAEPRARTSEISSHAASAADGGGRRAVPSTPQDFRAGPTQTPQSSAEDSGAAEAPPAQTTVFECDLSRVLSQRKRERQGDVEPLLASYLIAACAEALRAVPDIAAGNLHSTRSPNAELAPRLGVSLTTTDGSVRRALVDAAGTPLDERMRAVDVQLRTSAGDDLRSADILIHYYAASGSLLATPTAIGAGHVGSLGIGRVRRELVVRTVDGQEAPRVAALCYLTLTFRPEHIALERANRFVGEWVRVLEQWPIDPTTTV